MGVVPGDMLISSAKLYIFKDYHWPIGQPFQVLLNPLTGQSFRLLLISGGPKPSEFFNGFRRI